MWPLSLTSAIKTTSAAAARGVQKLSKSLGITKVTSSSQLPETVSTSGAGATSKAAMANKDTMPSRMAPKKMASFLASKTQPSAVQNATKRYSLTQDRNTKTDSPFSSGVILREYKKAIELNKELNEVLKARSSNTKESETNTEIVTKRPVKLDDKLDLKIENQQASKSQTVEKIKLVGKEFDQDSLMFSHSLQKTADKYGVIIGLRTPSPLSQAHLRENLPTKNFHVKAKSSLVGPTAGFIAKDPKYSKVGPDGWEKQAQNIQKALDAGASLVDLTLSENQLESAIKLGGLKKIAEGKYSATYHAESVNFIINPPDNKVLTEDGEPVQVLTNPPEKKGIATGLKPITADYDLFSIVPRENQAVNLRPLELGHNLALEAKSVSDDEMKGQQNDYLEKGGKDAFKKAILSFTQPRLERRPSDPDKGNVHRFGTTIINDINRNAKNEGYEGGKLCWHGDEEGNPFSPGFDPADKPIFYIPGQAPQQIASLAELNKFYDELRHAGYSPEASPKIGGVKSPHF